MDTEKQMLIYLYFVFYWNILKQATPVLTLIAL